MVRWISVHAWHCCQHFQSANVLEVVWACSILQHLEVQLLISLINCKDLRGLFYVLPTYGWIIWYMGKDEMCGHVGWTCYWFLMAQPNGFPKAFKSIQDLDIKCPHSHYEQLAFCKVWKLK
jgi:hypothetical protein